MNFLSLSPHQQQQTTKSFGKALVVPRKSTGRIVVGVFIAPPFGRFRLDALPCLDVRNSLLSDGRHTSAAAQEKNCFN